MGRPKSKTYLVLVEFRDKENFNNVYGVGADVSDFEQDRLDKMVSNGVVEVIEGKSKLSADKVKEQEEAEKAAEESRQAELKANTETLEAIAKADAAKKEAEKEQAATAEKEAGQADKK